MQPEATKHCISACYSAILWKLLKLKKGMITNGMTTRQQQQQLKIHLNDYMLLLNEPIISSNVILVRDQAYLSVCDLLIAFSKKLEDNPLLKPVVYVPDPVVQQTLTNFIQKYVFFEEKDKSEISEEKSETKMVEEDKQHLEHTKMDDEDKEHGNCVELHKHRNYLAGFCKLVVYNVLPIQSAADVFRHYVKYYNDYGDIIKIAIAKLSPTSIEMPFFLQPTLT